jgi:hypothetical protein
MIMSECKAMLIAARARWPEMVENPRIVTTDKGTLVVSHRLYDGEWIELEQVGRWRLGYGKRSQMLVIGREKEK